MNCHLPKEEPKINGNIQMNMYDVNKQLISQFPPLDDEQLKASCDLITAFAKEKNNTYQMLLCRDIGYYTLFHISFVAEWEEYFCDMVIECVSSVGSIKAIDQVEGAIEIWVQPKEQEPMAMYLFPYDAGVIECTL
jgi:hypothetical protein